MENIFKYYEFSDFFEDKSDTFSGNEICYTVLNEQHFLIFEKISDKYNLYVSRYTSEDAIGVKSPMKFEMLVKYYDKSIPEHRLILRRYLE